MWYAYALGQFPGGILGDRLGARTILVTSTLISTVTLSVVALAWNAYMLFVATALFGFGTALYGTTRFTVLTDVYSKRAGTSVALTLAAGDIGNAVLPFIAVSLTTWFSWRVGIGFSVPLFLLMGLFLWYSIPKGPLHYEEGGEVSNDSDTEPNTSLKYIVMNILVEPVLVATAIQFLAFFAWQGFTSFFVTYLIQEKSLTAATASSLFGFFFFMGLFVRPISGSSHDFLGPRRTLMIVLSLITVGLVGLTFAQKFVLLVILTVVLSSLLGFTPTTQTFITNALPEDMKGSGLGLLRTSHMLFGATSALFVGTVADLGYFDEAFLILAGASGVAAVLSLFLPGMD
jgi:MFS family permease